ncbi:MAG TPA: protein translocase subunit SecF [Ruminococcaceae bacterium]|nr:protein translocase subunit SecF [Oscillospiraceae bacterium]
MRKERTFNFTKNLKIFAIISCAIFVVGIVVNLIFGLELDINFKGGTIFTYSYTGDIDVNAVEQTIEETIEQDVSVSQSTDITGDSTNLVVSLASSQSLSTEMQENIGNALNEKFPDNALERLSYNSVNPTIGSRFFAKSLYAVGLAALLVIIYIGLRFRKIGGVSAGISALIALIHDCIIVYFVYVIFGIPLDDNFVAVVLTILGYSLNATIVIFDRIRENRRIYGQNITLNEMVNKSVSQTLGRTIVTSLVTFVAIFTVFIVAYLRGLESIISFALPMSIGVISGCYSSVCLASPLWVLWQNRKAKRAADKADKPKKPKAVKSK